MYSKLLNKHYSQDNGSVCYIGNMTQCFKYLQNGAEEDLVDILYTNTKNNCLVFVFKKTEHIKSLYNKWQAHEL